MTYFGTGWKTLALAGAMSLAVAAVGRAQDGPIKIGFISTTSGPLGTLGQDSLNGFSLALELMDNKLGGRPVELLKEDDQVKVDQAVQIATKFVQSDNVDLVVGGTYSNILMGIYKPVTDAGKIMVSAGGGATPLAGELCTPNLFVTANANDAAPLALAAMMNKRGVKSVFMMAPNYEAGINTTNGFRAAFKGEIEGQVLTTLNQPDYQAELAQARAANPDAIFAFYFGGMAPTFFKQFSQMGMGNIGLYTVQAVDATTLPAIGKTAVGSFLSNNWNADLDNAPNKKFVDAFRKKFGKDPTSFGAWAYDTALLLDAAIKANGGKTDSKSLRKAMREVKFNSIRGSFSFNPVNQFPVQNFYAIEVKNGTDGKPVMVSGEVVAQIRSDTISGCKMPAE